MNEFTWYGGISKFGKREDFVIEHLVFAGNNIEGYVSQNNALVQLKGSFVSPIGLQNDPKSLKKMFFKLEGKNLTTKIKYEFNGYFVKNEIRGLLQDNPPKMVPRVITLDSKSVPCTVFLEPGKRLCQGSFVSIENRILILFNEKDTMNILSMYKNRYDTYIGYYTRGGGAALPDVSIMVQTALPAKVKNKANTYSFADLGQTHGMVVELSGSTQQVLNQYTRNNSLRRF